MPGIIAAAFISGNIDTDFGVIIESPFLISFRFIANGTRAQKYSLSTVTQPTAASGWNSSQETNPAKATRKGRNKCLVLIIIWY